MFIPSPSKIPVREWVSISDNWASWGTLGISRDMAGVGCKVYWHLEMLLNMVKHTGLPPPTPTKNYLAQLQLAVSLFGTLSFRNTRLAYPQSGPGEQPVNAEMDGIAEQCFSLSLSLPRLPTFPLPLSLKLKNP